MAQLDTGLLVATTSKPTDIYPGVQRDPSQDTRYHRENLLLPSASDRRQYRVQATYALDGAVSGRPGFDYLDPLRASGKRLFNQPVVYDVAFVADTPESVARNIAAGIRLGS